MSGPEQRDYGTTDSSVALVPEALTTYRHFSLSNGQLWPMGGLGTHGGYNPYRLAGMRATLPPTAQWAIPGCNCALCRTAEVPRPQSTYLPPDGYFQAECLYRDYVLIGGSTHRPNHPAPRKTCKCGFYAHYSPQEDFYPSLKWSWNLPGSRQINPYLNGSAECAMIKAVVQMSGRIIMGTKGVRAERLKIIALAPDWDKLVLDVPEWHTSPSVNGVGLGFDWGWYRRSEVTAMQEEEVHDRILSALHFAADAYQAEVYTEPEVMYEKHPQPDISHLLESE